MKKWTTSNSTEIYQVLNGRINCYLVCNNYGLVLIDCGLTRLAGKLIKNLEKVNQEENTIDYLFLTHAHFDHSESAAQISEKFKARIVIHSSEAINLMQGITNVPKGTNLITRGLINLARKFLDLTVRCPDVTIYSNGTLFSSAAMQIIHTPGHSQGSMSLIVDDEVAFVGDALFGVFRNKAIPPFADDVEELVESWGKLLETNCKLFLPGHGSPILRKTLEKEYLKRSL